MPSSLKLQTRKAKLGPFNASSAREDTRSQSSQKDKDERSRIKDQGSRDLIQTKALHFTARKALVQG